jgi:hypothetical protein
MSNCWSCVECNPRDVCPPWVAQAGLHVPTTYAGFSFCITPEELRCDFGAEIDELAGTTCDNVTTCTAVQNAINTACARVWTSIGRCYALPLQSEGDTPLYPSAIVAEALPPGSVAFNVYWILRNWMGVIARYQLWKDMRSISEGDQVPMAVRQYREVRDLLAKAGTCGGCCDMLSGVLRRVEVQPSASGFAVAFRSSHDKPLRSTINLGHHSSCCGGGSSHGF